MTYQDAIAALRRILIANGEDAILRRPTTPPEDVTVRVFVRKAEPKDLTGSIQQEELIVILGDTEIADLGWSSPILLGDHVIIRGKTYSVIKREVILLQDKIVRHDLRVRG
jgi:hypothetical protein